VRFLALAAAMPPECERKKAAHPKFQRRELAAS
jgi:hypothetical protein